MSHPSSRPPRARRRLAVLGAAIAVACCAPAVAHAAVANDHIADALELTIPHDTSTSSATGTTSAATRQTGEPWVLFEYEGAAGPATAPGTVWYRFTAPRTERLTLSTCNPDTKYGASMAVWRADGTETPGFADLMNVTRSRPVPDPCPLGSGHRSGRGSHAQITAVAGSTYYVQLSGFSIDDAIATQGTFRLDVTRNPPEAIEIVSGPADGSSVPNADLRWTFKTPQTGDDWAIRCTVDRSPVSDVCVSDGSDDGTKVAVFPMLCQGKHTFEIGGTSRLAVIPATRTVTVTDGPACAAPELSIISAHSGLAPEFNHHANTAATPTRITIEVGRSFSTFDEVYEAFGVVGTRWSFSRATLGPVEPDVAYYLRYTMTTAAGTASTTVGPTVLAHSLNGPVPVEARVGPASDVGQTSVTLVGYGGIPTQPLSVLSTTVRFEVRPVGGTLVPSPVLSRGSGGSFDVHLTNLTPGTTYEYRLVAGMGDSMERSAWRTFTTLPAPPAPAPDPTPEPGLGPTPGPTPPIPAPPVPGPTIPGPSGTATTTVVTNPAAPWTVAQVQSDLRAGVKALRKSATRKRLRAGKPFTVTVTTRATGTLTLTGSLRKGKKGKAVTAVRGTARVTKPGKVRVRLTVTKAGKKLAKGKGQLQLALKAMLKPASGATVSVTQSAKLK